jgi:hypothetical protein
MTVTRENGKKKVVDETAFHLDLQKAITEVKGLIAKGMFRSMCATLTKVNALPQQSLGN